MKLGGYLEESGMIRRELYKSNIFVMEKQFLTFSGVKDCTLKREALSKYLFFFFLFSLYFLYFK